MVTGLKKTFERCCQKRTQLEQTEWYETEEVLLGLKQMEEVKCMAVSPGTAILIHGHSKEERWGEEEKKM